ncbi:hypothetical protein HNQ91_000385 [Filimonas zeae]|nr:hypothetical protein [Filimonas zeae]
MGKYTSHKEKMPLADKTAERYSGSFKSLVEVWVIILPELIRPAERSISTYGCFRRPPEQISNFPDRTAKLPD